MKSRITITTLFLLLLIGMGVFLQETQASLFLYREQQQIFLWDGDYISSLLIQVGGLSTLAAQFLIQFFTIPYMGALTTAALIGITACFLWLTVKRWGCSWWLLPVVMLAPCVQAIYLLDMGYHYEGLIALLFCTVLLYGYSVIADTSSWWMRTLTGCVFSACLFLYIGSVATLFALCAFLTDLLHKRKKGWLSAVYLLICITLALFTVANGTVVGYDYALWTKGYYEYYVEQDLWHAVSWLLVPLIVLVASVAERFQLKPILQTALCIILLAAGGVFLYVQSAKRTNQDFRTLAELMDSINHEDWEGVVNNPALNYQNYLHLNCLNLALSHQGRLMTDLLKYPQKGAQSLMVGYQAYNDLNVLFSHIYYHTGVISEALCLSFGTMIATTHGNPSLLKLLIKERLIYGDYEVAEKYITRLEKTFAYQAWATDMRRFLYNDEAVGGDPELGQKRKSLPAPQPSFVVVDGVMADFIKVIESDTDEQHALEYAMAMMMLDKNMDGIRYLADRYLPYQNGEDVPQLMQQALTVLAEHDEDYCRSHGVNDETISRFMSFKQTVLNARRSNANLQAALASYKGTFWYYYMFQ